MTENSTFVTRDPDDREIAVLNALIHRHDAAALSAYRHLRWMFRAMDESLRKNGNDPDKITNINPGTHAEGTNDETARMVRWEIEGAMKNMPAYHAEVLGHIKAGDELRRKVLGLLGDVDFHGGPAFAEDIDAAQERGRQAIARRKQLEEEARLRTLDFNRREAERQAREGE